MPVALDAMMAELSPEDRAEVERGVSSIVMQNRTLAEIRKSRNVTQAQLAKLLGTTQANVSKLEKQDDVLLSTVDRIAGALGGKVKLVVEFPNDASVALDVISLANARPRRGGRMRLAAERTLPKAKGVG